MEAKSLQQSNLDSHELLDLKQIIQFGTKIPEDYSVLFYKSVYNQDFKVRIRGLSNYEYDIIGLEMYKEISDPVTIKYLFNPKNEKDLENMKDNEESENKVKEDNPNLDIVGITKSYLYRNILIVFYAMKDFYPNLTINDVKQLEGISEIASRVNNKSGRTEEIMKKISFFRESQRKLDSPISPK